MLTNKQAITKEYRIVHTSTFSLFERNILEGINLQHVVLLKGCTYIKIIVTIKEPNLEALYSENISKYIENFGGNVTLQ